MRHYRANGIKTIVAAAMILLVVPASAADNVTAGCVLNEFPHETAPVVGDGPLVGDAPDEQAVPVAAGGSTPTCWNGKLSPYGLEDAEQDVDTYSFAPGGMQWVTLYLPHDVACVDVTTRIVSLITLTGEPLWDGGTQTVCDPGGKLDWFFVSAVDTRFELGIATHAPLDGAQGVYGIVA